MKNFIILLSLYFSISNVMAQPISIGNGTLQSNSPYLPFTEYSYAQTIYLENEIQASGNITSLTFYYTNGTTLSNSDSISIYLGTSQRDYFDLTHKWFPVSSMTKVFDTVITNYTVPGSVTINLQTPFYYGGDSNLVVAVNDLRAGFESGWFLGTTKSFGRYARVLMADGGFNPVDPNNPPNAPGYGAIGNVTINGLTLLPCQSPKNIRFDSVSYNSTKIIWSSSISGNTSTRYDIYYDTINNKPILTTIPKQSNIIDTQIVVNSLIPNSKYYCWARSRSTSGCISVWTIIDSFKTICAPTTTPTQSEQFNTFIPECWDIAKGVLANPTVFETNDSRWGLREYASQTGSGNYAPYILIYSALVHHWLVSPSYDLGTGNNRNLEFDMALTKNGSTAQGVMDNDDKFIVVVSTDNGQTWSTNNTLRQWSYLQSIPAIGQHYILPLNSYTGVVRIGFYAESTSGTASGSNIPALFIDNVKISEIMPVKLLEFSGHKESTNNFLTWRTATEQNNRGFELQRSANGREFSSIGFVPTKANAGNSTGELSYQFADKKPLAAGSYYRLKQVDFDGKFSYSNIVFINGEGVTDLSIASLYPNPSHQQLNVAVQAPTAKTVQLIISDIAGKVVQQKTLQLQKGNNNKVVNVASLAKGTYVIKVVCADGCEAAVSKFVKE